jgi:hypothetical protein
MQKVFICTTFKPDFHDLIIKHVFEDNQVPRKDYTNYPTVFHALGDNWRLLAPPNEHMADWDGYKVKLCTWWLVKD